MPDIMKKPNCYVDIHMLHTLPPSCINRDDTGSPKTATYGGVSRSRVSSQSWKHAIRKYFYDVFPAEDVGTRTKAVPNMIAEKIIEKDPSMKMDKAVKLANAALKKAGNDPKDEENMKALFFVSNRQVDLFAELAIQKADQLEKNDEEDEEKPGSKGKKKKKSKQDKELLQALIDSPSIDMVLFGRMVAKLPSLNYDAAAQVNHALSTHAVETEYDYFTAVDDLADKDSSGAAHLGTVEFNSSTLYRYANINVNELGNRFPKEKVIEAVKGFVEGMIYSMPTGRQNSFANRTLPYAIYVTIRTDMPVCLENAFEKPVQPVPGEGYEAPSAERLYAHATELYKNFVSSPSASFVVGEMLGDLSENKGSVQTMLDFLETELSNRIIEEEMV